MITREMPLMVSGQATVDANGRASVELKPTSFGEMWVVTTVGYKVSSSVSEPIAKFYVSGVFIGGTYTGSLGSATGVSVFQTNQPARMDWEQADVGATVELTLHGTRKIVGP